jgi:hypothetical protein
MSNFDEFHSLLCFGLLSKHTNSFILCSVLQNCIPKHYLIFIMSSRAFSASAGSLNIRD